MCSYNSKLDLLSLREFYDQQVRTQAFGNTEPEHWWKASQFSDRKIVLVEGVVRRVRKKSKALYRLDKHWEW